MRGLVERRDGLLPQPERPGVVATSEFHASLVAVDDIAEAISVSAES